MATAAEAEDGEDDDIRRSTVRSFIDSLLSSYTSNSCGRVFTADDATDTLYRSNGDYSLPYTQGRQK